MSASEVGGKAALYGAQTALSLAHFGSTGRLLSDLPDLVVVLAKIKRAAARANLTLGVLDGATAEAIINSAVEIEGGAHLDQFPTSLVLGGGGTTTNMNINEVLASRASQLSRRPVHPNDHVNASQSTNDVIPTAFAIVLRRRAAGSVAALRGLATSLLRKAAEFSDITYLGRTCLQDAVSMKAGDSLRAQARAVTRGADEIAHAAQCLAEVPLGGTIVGTGIGAPLGFTEVVMVELQALLDVTVQSSADPHDTVAYLDPYVAIADAASRAAGTVARIGSDLRLRASGPAGGFAEVALPALLAGSSIMPGKVNPVVPELAMQLSFRIHGNAQVVRSGVGGGELELNVMEPIIFDSAVQIFDDLEKAATSMAALCIDGLEWRGARSEENLAAAVDRWVVAAAEHGYLVAEADRRQDQGLS